MCDSELLLAFSVLRKWPQFPQSLFCAVVPHYNLSIVTSCTHQKWEAKSKNYIENLQHIACCFLVFLCEQNLKIWTINTNFLPTQTLLLSSCCWIMQATKTTFEKIKLNICPQLPSVSPSQPWTLTSRESAFQIIYIIYKKVCARACVCVYHIKQKSYQVARQLNSRS